ADRAAARRTHPPPDRSPDPRPPLRRPRPRPARWRGSRQAHRQECRKDPAGGGKPMKNILFRWEMALFLMLVAELAVFGFINPRFLNVGNLIYGTSDFVQIGIVALPLTLVIIAGGIDVSFASAIGLCAIVFGVSNFFGVPLPLAVGLGLVAGALAGLLSATVIHLSKIQPLVVTLGSLYLFQGAATVLSGVVGAGGYEGIGNFPASFTSVGYAEFLGLPAPLAVFLGLAAVLVVLLHFTRFGRAVFLIGQSAEAARYSGLSVMTTQTIT